MSYVEGDKLSNDKDGMTYNSLKDPSESKRRRQQCRASSLLDGQEEDDEECHHKEPGLVYLTDEDSDTSSSQDKSKGVTCPDPMEVETKSEPLALEGKTEGEALVKEFPVEKTAAMESISLITEGVASYLCPLTYERRTGHVRKLSDTDTYQQHAFFGPCGTDACWDQRSGFPINLSASQSEFDADHLSYQRVLQNRCAARAAQARRVQQLWDNWHSTPGDSPMSARERGLLKRSGLNSNTNQESSQLKGWNLGVTKSLDGVMEVNTISDAASPVISPLSNDQFTFADVMLSRRQAPKYAPPDLMEIEGVSDLYYDSDPEVFRSNRSPRSEAMASSPPPLSPLRFSRSRSEPLTQRRHRVTPPPPIDTSTDAMEGDEDNTPPPPPLTPRHSGGAINRKRSETGGSMDLSDEQLVLNFIEELAVGTVTLVWHPSPDDEHNEVLGSPVSVQAFFEMGSLLASKLVQPKFMWRSIYQPDLNRKRLSMSSTTPHSVELLSIVKVLKPSSIDRAAYPFCKLSHTFSLTCQNNKVYVFEACSTQERDWLVRGLKLVVSRLASKIIVGDDHVFREFFSPFGQHLSPSSSNPLKHSSSSSSSSCSSDEALANSSSGNTHDCSREEDQRPGTHTSESVIGSVILSTTDKSRRDLWGTSFWK